MYYSVICEGIQRLQMILGETGHAFLCYSFQESRMITPEYQEWKEMFMDEITRFPAARLSKDGRIITIPQCTNFSATQLL